MKLQLTQYLKLNLIRLTILQQRLLNALMYIDILINLQGVKRESENIRVKDDVGETMNRSIGLWSSMMMSLGNRTSFNVNN